MRIRNALLGESVERNVPVLLLQMADGKNIDNQNEDRLLMSDNENRLQQLERPESPLEMKKTEIVAYDA